MGKGNKTISNSSAANTTATIHTISQSSKTLQDRLHELLTRLSGTIEHVRNWPDGDDATIQTERAKLISKIRETVASIQRVENCVKNDITLKKSLQNCRIPLDLLELLEFELNPDCFTRGLLREAMGQLAGLKRRKLALEMLGSAIQKGLDERERDEKNILMNNTTLSKKGKSTLNGTEVVVAGDVGNETEPLPKKAKILRED